MLSWTLQCMLPGMQACDIMQDTKKIVKNGTHFFSRGICF